MLISPGSLKFLFGVTPVGVLHVGAHEAEEAEMYDQVFATEVIWVEAQESLAMMLKERFQGTKHQVVHAVVWDCAGVKLKFKNASNSQSSSLLGLGTHAKSYPSIQIIDEIEVVTTTLADVVPINFTADFVNLDIQGAELKALKGFSERFSGINWIYSEVNSEEVYEGCSLVTEMDKFLKGYDFHRVETRWFLGHGWGDALYVKSDNILEILKLKIFGGFHSMPWMIRELMKFPLRKTLSKVVDLKERLGL